MNFDHNQDISLVPLLGTVKMYIVWTPSCIKEEAELSFWGFFKGGRVNRPDGVDKGEVMGGS